MPKPINASVLDALLCSKKGQEEKLMPGSSVIDLKPTVDLDGFGSVWMFITQQDSSDPWQAFEKALSDAGVRIKEFKGRTPDEADTWLYYFNDKIRTNSDKIIEKASYQFHTMIPIHPAMDLLGLSKQSTITKGTTAEYIGSLEDTYGVPQPEHGYWNFITPTDTQLAFDLNAATQQQALGTAKHFLTDQLLRTWLGTFALAKPGDDGQFHLNMTDFIGNILGYKLQEGVRNGVIVRRPNRKTDRDIKKNLLTLKKTLVCGFKNVDIDPPQQLLKETIYTDRATGKQVTTWEHSRVVWAKTKRDFIQLPRKALHLDARQTPTALGLAIFLKETANGKGFRWLNSGKINISLETLAYSLHLGQQIEMKTSKQSKKQAYSWAANMIAEVTEKGTFGTIHIPESPTANTPIILEPSIALSSIYARLIKARERKIKATERREANLSRPRGARTKLIE